MNLPTKKKQIQQEPFLGIQLSLVQTGKLNSVVNTIFDYRALAGIDLNHQIKSLSQLPHQILSSYPQLEERQSNIQQCIQSNHKFIHSVIDNIKVPLKYQNNNHYYPRSKLLNLFKDISYEWSFSGELYRKYIITIKILLQKFSKTKTILVAGGYLGRLIFELSQNYNVNANEEQFDYFLVANYFLNMSTQSKEIYPFVHNLCNHLVEKHIYKKSTVPDVQIWNSINDRQVAISLGRFDWIYRFHTNSWDSIVFNFVFQRNDPIRLLQRAHDCLKQNGILISVTTLTFTSGNQLSYQQIIDIAKSLGFVVIDEIQQIYSPLDDQYLLKAQQIRYYTVFQKRSKPK